MKSLRGERVLVTGAGGFIGSHLVEKLLERGARVTAFARYTSRAEAGNLRFLPPEASRDIEVVFGDIRDPEAIRAAMMHQSIVFHLAALIAIPYSYLHPREVIDTNVVGTLNVLEAARHTLPQRIVHISTSEVYGSALAVPINESHPLQAQSPYSASKIGADRIAESYYRAFDLPIVTVRPFNTYGPRQSARAVIPTIITQLIAGERLQLGSLFPTRDFTFVTDTAEGMARAAESDDVVGREINLGSGKEISIAALARTVSAICGAPADVASNPARRRPKKSEVDRLVADATLAHDLLDWHPKVVLQEGLAATVEWIRGHMHLYRPDTYQL